jgi:outer membrane lipoprotein-sorting protein
MRSGCFRSRRLLAAFAVIWFAGAFASAQANAPAASGNLEKVLSQIDTAAASFKSAEANFVWDQFQKVINETDTQKGKIYFRRQNNKEMQMLADVTEPDPKTVLFAGGKGQLYQPKIDQVTEYNLGKNRAEFESYVVLGFGGGGHDLLKLYDVKDLGQETVQGVNAAKLELVPKSAKVRNTFARILLWIDPARGVSVQQQFFEPTGDYRLAKYSDIQLNQKIPDSVFKLKTTGKTKVVSPQG